MMITITVDKDEIINTLAKAMKYDALVNAGVRENWMFFYDALSNNYPEPAPDGDYDELYTEIATKVIEGVEKCQ